MTIPPAPNALMALFTLLPERGTEWSLEARCAWLRAIEAAWHVTHPTDPWLQVNIVTSTPEELGR